MQQLDERDKQKRVGPSDLSKTCEWCLADKMIGTHEPSPGGLAAWIGTAMHGKLEADERDPSTYRERKVFVGGIGVYGNVWGTIDRFDEQHHTAVDYKGSKKADIKKYGNSYLILDDGRVEFYSNTLLEYYRQVNLYGLALNEDGHEVENVAIFFIPRDSNRFEDCKYIEFPYNRDLALQVLARAEAIYTYVSEHGMVGLEPDPECWDCRREGRLNG